MPGLASIGWRAPRLAIMHPQLSVHFAWFRLAVRTHVREAAAIMPAPFATASGCSTVSLADWSPVRCSSRTAILVALVTLGGICHAQMPRPDASDVKSCETELAICQALLGTVGGQEAKGGVRLVDVAPSSTSGGSRSHSPAVVWPSNAWTA